MKILSTPELRKGKHSLGAFQYTPHVNQKDVAKTYLRNQGQNAFKLVTATVQ